MKKIHLARITTVIAILMAICLIFGSNAFAQEKTVRLVLEDWSSEIGSTNLVRAVIREKLGYQVILKRMSVTDQFEAISAGTHDALVGNWMPGQSTYHDKYKENFEDLGPNLVGTRIGLVVPNMTSGWLQAESGTTSEQYMKIDSIEEIRDHYDDFNGKIIGIESDSGMMTIMREKLIPAYGLEDFELIPGTEVSMVAELANAIKKQRWVVVTGWTPHWKFGRWALKFLEDPKKIWDEGGEIRTLVRKGLKEDMPDVYKFLDNFNWKPADMEVLLLWNEMGGNPYDNAKRWISNHPKEVENWLK